ncbi:MAG: hypothetical protein ATN36_08900 [Epulopiscium sp. Nele67-Bin005]|nr:MAG: hypothetical protein ATN36_08900 [Epulopiscium sp. Nele67-Bin005]
MEIPMHAIGFSSIMKQGDLDELVEVTLLEPTYQNITTEKTKLKIAEYRREVAPNTYIMVRVSITEENGQASCFNIEECEACVDSTIKTHVEEIEVEKLDEMLYYVVCEEKTTAMQLVFWLQNLVHYLNLSALGKKPIGASVLGVALEGTIILPITKEADDEQFEEEERERFRTLVKRIREGDETARDELEEEEQDIDDQLRERLKDEDFLTIMSGYFIPLSDDESIYAILGDIIDIQTRTNNQTKEKMYVFTLDVNGMHLQVVINHLTLIGMPMVGMRFMGSCWLQGRVIMED